MTAGGQTHSQVRKRGNKANALLLNTAVKVSGDASNVSKFLVNRMIAGVGALGKSVPKSTWPGLAISKSALRVAGLAEMAVS